MGRGDREVEGDAESKGTMMRTKTQQTETRYPRLQTGIFQYDERDWPGIFIGGDDALGHAGAIRAVLRQSEKAIEAAREQGASTSEFESLMDLAELLESCRVEQKKGR
jgi:hypothetical protein